MILLVPGYFLRCSPTCRSRSAQSSSTFESIRASNSSADFVEMPPPLQALNIFALPLDLAAHVFDFGPDGF
jgi:hypothetical protein